MTEAILTIDLGTTRLKVALFDVEGRLIAQLSQRNTEYARENQFWQSADDWWNACKKLVQTLLKQKTHQQPALSLIACSLSGRAGAGVFLDQTGNVIEQPWLDNRHGTLLESIRAEDHTVPAYAAMLVAKLLWLRENSPAISDNLKHALYAKDYMLYRLTGETVTDPASGPDGLTWPQGWLNELDVDSALLPSSAMPWDTVGQVSDLAAHETGIPSGTPVVLGAHDGVCANVGAGAINPGEYAVTLGTHAVVRTITEQIPAGAYRFYGLPPDRHVLGGNALMAGRSLDWFIDNWTDSQETERQDVFKRLNEEAGKESPGARGIRFFPYLAGQVAPESRLNARGVLTGLSVRHNRTHMYRALLEGTSFAIGRVFQQVSAWGEIPSYIGLTGSGAISAAWVSILTHVINKPLHLSDGSAEGRGAAIYAALGRGYYNSLQEAVNAMVNKEKISEPDKSIAKVYSRLFEEWNELNEKTRPFDKPL